MPRRPLSRLPRRAAQTRLGWPVVAVVGLLLAVAPWGPSLARADAAAEVSVAPGFSWDASSPRYPEVTTAEWLVGATSLTAAAGILFFWQPSSPNWVGPILFDDAVQRALRIDDDGDRALALGISDVAFYSLMVLPTLVDVGLVTALVHGKPRVAGQMVGMNLLSYGTAGVLAYSVATLSARERPFTPYCEDRPDYDPGCNNPASENASFFSGHATAAFAGAGVTCAHHTYLPLYGGGLPDALACAVAVTMASSVAILRVATDNHYISDSIVGSAIGFGLGYGLPYLLHYRRAELPAQLSITPMVNRGVYGLRVGW